MNPTQSPAQLDWKVIAVDDTKSMKALEELLNDSWVVTQVHGDLFILARVKQTNIKLV